MIRTYICQEPGCRIRIKKGAKRCAKHQVLFFIRESGSLPIHMRDLSEALNVEPAVVTSIVKRLAKDGSVLFHAKTRSVALIN